MAHKVKTCLWFDDQALDAAELYIDLIANSKITQIGRYPEGNGMAEPGKVLIVELEIGGTPYQFLNGGPHFKLDEAASISVSTKDQEETDALWSALTANGGSESQCGWLKDRFGVSWQIVPQRSVELLAGPTAAKVWPALMQMKKIDIAALEAAAAA